jgi:hypothetical protein
MELTYQVLSTVISGQWVQTLQHGTQGQSTLRKLRDVQRKRAVVHRLHG